jgi:hypothetical protein
MKQIILLTLLLTFFMDLVIAQELKYELHGNVREWIKIFMHSPAEMSLSETRAKFELTSTGGTSSAFHILSYYTYDGLNRNGALDLKEAYVDYYSEVVDVRFGKQIITWGKADELNPTDVLCPQNMANFNEEKSIRKFGLLFLKTDWNIANFTLSAIWKPEFEYFRIPPLDSRWAFFSLPGITALPQPVCPNRSLSNTEWAFKFARSFGRIDVSVSWFDGWDNIFTPVFVFDTTIQQLQLNSLTFHRTRMLGADFAGVAGPFGFWGEGAFFFTEDADGVDPNIKNPYAQIVLGSDYDFGNNVKVNIQYFQEIVSKIDNNAEQSAEERMISKLGMGMPIQSAVSCRIEKKFGEGDAHRAEIMALYDLKQYGFMVTPKLVYSPEDAITIEVGVTFFDGESASLFGRFVNNDELYVRGIYSF